MRQTHKATTTANQAGLFESRAALPHGLIYRPDFISAAEETELLDAFAALPFRAAQFQQYTARRRVVHFGEQSYPARYRNDVAPMPTIPGFLLPLRRRVARWQGVAEADFVHVLVSEYQPGTPIGWHRDAPQFDIVVGISLASATRMRFRPHAARHGPKAVISLLLEPRSAYVMCGEIRWHWQHHIPPTKALRYSITLRTRCADSPPEFDASLRN